MASPLEILLEAVAESGDVEELKKLLDEHGVPRVLRHYERLKKKHYGDPRLSNLSRALSWALGFRRKLEGRPFVLLLVAQPVVLDLTDLKREVSARLPTASMQKMMHGLYGLPEGFKIRYSPTLISPNDVTVYDAEAVARTLEESEAPDVAFTAPGWHFRFITVLVELFALQGDLALSNPKPMTQLLKVHYGAKAVYLPQPVEVFDLWILYDFLNSGGRRA